MKVASVTVIAINQILAERLVCSREAANAGLAIVAVELIYSFPALLMLVSSQSQQYQSHQMI